MLKKCDKEIFYYDGKLSNFGLWHLSKLLQTTLLKILKPSLTKRIDFTLIFFYKLITSNNFNLNTYKFLISIKIIDNLIIIEYETIIETIKPFSFYEILEENKLQEDYLLIKKYAININYSFNSHHDNIFRNYIEFNLDNSLLLLN